MLRELREDAIVDFFKKELSAIKFVPEANYPDIEQRLDILADSGEKRYRKTEAARWIWKFFVEKSLSDITDNLRGYHELCRYFDEFADYENLLFALDKNHRDHVIHSIWVMLLGLYLRKTFAPLKNIDYEVILPNFYKKQGKVVEAIKRTQNITKEHETSLWCLIALTHDLGYPIQKTTNANELMAKMVSNFGFLEQKDFRYSFTIVHQTAISELLNIVSSFVAWMPSGGYRVGYFSGGRLDYAKSFERLDHGIMSAYLLQMHLDCICELMSIPQEVPELQLIDHEVASKQVTTITLLRAISAHTNKNVYWPEVNLMDPLLLLSDELDEFSRYSRSLESNEWIKVGCRTEFECTKNSLQVKYTFDNKDIGDDIESFFKDKVEKLWKRFELEDGKIRKISVTCRDVRKAQPVDFIYEKTLSQDSPDVVKRTLGKSSNDIQAFLDGAVNLSP